MSNDAKTQNTEEANMDVAYGFYSLAQREVMGRCLEYLRPGGGLVCVTEIIRSNTTPKPNKNYPDSYCCGEVKSYYNTIYDRPTQRKVMGRCLQYHLSGDDWIG